VQSVSILVVDDYERFREFICTFLRQSGGFRISQASDGAEAVQKFRELQPDLMLLDIGLPELNGLDVARELASPANILFLSQESSSDIVQEALRLGAGYLHKPRVQSELLPAIEAVLAGKRYVSGGLEFCEETQGKDRPGTESKDFPAGEPPCIRVCDE
jgi:DNA-binding response OmpR family regulator